MAVEKRASVSGQTIRLLQCLNRHFNLIIDVIKKRTQDGIVKKPDQRSFDRFLTDQQKCLLYSWLGHNILSKCLVLEFPVNSSLLNGVRKSFCLCVLLQNHSCKVHFTFQAAQNELKEVELLASCIEIKITQIEQKYNH